MWRETDLLLRKVADESKPVSFVETSYLNTDMCRLESLQKKQGPIGRCRGSLQQAQTLWLFQKNSDILFFNLCVQYILRLITGWNYIRLSYSSHCKPISFQNTTQNCFVKILAPEVKMGLRRPCNLKSDAPSANLGCKIWFSPNAVCPRALSSVACETSTSEADSSVKINPAVPWK